MKTRLLGLICLLFVPFWLVSQDSPRPEDKVRWAAPNGGDDFLFTIALGGLKLRKAPSFNGETIATMPFGSKVRLLNPDQLHVNEEELVWTTDSIPGAWKEVEWKGKKGWAFSGFLNGQIVEMGAEKDLLFADAGTCWSDCVYSPGYFYYGVFRTQDSTLSRLASFKPIFYNTNFDNFGAAIRANGPTYFILVSKSPMEKGAIQSSSTTKSLIIRKQNKATSQVYFEYQKVSLARQSWRLEIYAPRQDHSNGSTNWDDPRTLRLRDLETGQMQEFTPKEIDIPKINEAYLLWSGDLDFDRKPDFLIGIGYKDSGKAAGGSMLFLTKNAPSGKMVNSPIVSRWWACD